MLKNWGAVYTVTILVANILVIISWIANPNVSIESSPAVFFEGAKEILGGEFPASNFYPLGSKLLTVPFSVVSWGGLAAIFVFSNVGVLGYLKLASCVLQGWVRFLFIVLMLTSPYLWWSIVGSQDMSIEFALFPWVLYFAYSKRKVAFSLLGVLLIFVRPGNILWICLASLILAVIYRKPAWLLAITLVVAGMFLNLFVYGAFSTSFNGAYAAYIGQTTNHFLTHPLYDYDTVAEPYTQRVNESELEAYRRYSEMTRAEVTSDPTRFLALSLAKAESSLTHLLKVPTTAYQVDVGPADSYSFDVKYESPPLSRVIVDGVIFLNRLVGLAIVLFAFVAVAFNVSGLRVLRTKRNLFILPLLCALPIAIAATADTRFQLNAELASLLWGLGILWAALRKTPIGRDDSQAESNC